MNRGIVKGWSAERGASVVLVRGARRVPSSVLILTLWTLAAALPEVFWAEDPLTIALLSALYGCSALFALGACGWASAKSGTALGRWFWGLCSSGIGFMILGYLVWEIFGFRTPYQLGFVPRDPMYVLSYLLLFSALLYLVAVTTRGIFPLIPLDTIAVMVSAGLLGWYFVLGRALEGASQDLLRGAVLNFAGGVADFGLLFLALVVLSGDERPAFAGRLAGALFALVVADLTYFFGQPLGGENPGAFPVVVWSLGMVLLGLAALRGARDGGGLTGRARKVGISSWRTLSFWFGPLSPALQYAFLIWWVSLHPPAPRYVLWGGVFFVLYFGFRVSVLTLLNRGVRSETVGLARREEQARISRELRGSLERSVEELRERIVECRVALTGGDGDGAEDLLRRAEFEARQVGYQVALPIEELRGRCGEAFDPGAVLRSFAEDLCECFGLEVCVDLRDPLDGVEAREAAAVCRVVCEAMWNAARHAGAARVWLESRGVGSVLIVRVRDDGNGFSPEKVREGVGMRVMRLRAAEIGAGLDVISSPQRGTTVQLRLQR